MDVGEHQSRLLLTTLVCCLLLVACSTTSSASSPTCPSDTPKLGIYDPSRLKVLDTCQWFYGVVAEAERHSDGDLHILLRPDPNSTSFLNVENVNRGGMVVEIVPGQQLPDPAVGDHLSVFGTWVLDTHNGWNEIHPVWEITYPGGSTVQALPPDPPEYQGSAND